LKPCWYAQHQKGKGDGRAPNKGQPPSGKKTTQEKKLQKKINAMQDAMSGLGLNPTTLSALTGQSQTQSTQAADAASVASVSAVGPHHSASVVNAPQSQAITKQAQPKYDVYTGKRINAVYDGEDSLPSKTLTWFPFVHAEDKEGRQFGAAQTEQVQAQPLPHRQMVASRKGTLTRQVPERLLPAAVPQEALPRAPEESPDVKDYICTIGVREDLLRTTPMVGEKSEKCKRRHRANFSQSLGCSLGSIEDSILDGIPPDACHSSQEAILATQLPGKGGPEASTSILSETKRSS
jgi:hypothetical protein